MKQYRFYDHPIGDNGTLISMPLELKAADVVRVYATLATLSFALDGIKRT